MLTLRVSEIANYHDCPRRGAARIFRKAVEDCGYTLAHGEGWKPIHSAFGTAAHAGIASGARSAMDGYMPSIDSMVEVAAESLRVEISDGCEFDTTTRNINEADAQIKRICQAYRVLVLPELKPIAIERELKAAGSDFLLVGHPDIVCEDVIRDIKTGRMSTSHFVQLGGYALLAKANNLGGKAKSLVIDGFRRTRKVEEALVVASTGEAGTYMNIARSTINRIVSDFKTFETTKNPIVSFPENPSSNLCSPKYCPAHGADFCPITKEKKCVIL